MFFMDSNGADRPRQSIHTNHFLGLDNIHLSSQLFGVTRVSENASTLRAVASETVWERERDHLRDCRKTRVFPRVLLSHSPQVQKFLNQRNPHHEEKIPFIDLDMASTE